MPEEGTAVLDQPEEMSPGGLFSKEEYEKIQQEIVTAAKSREADIPRETEPVATETPPEPEAKVADDPAREPSADAAETVEPEVTETTEPPPTPESGDGPEVAFDDQLLVRAEQMGFSKEQAQAFGTPGNLEIALTAFDQRLIGLSKPKAAPTQPVVPPPAVPQVPVPPAQPAPVQQPISALTIDLDPEEHDSKIVEQFQKLHAHYEARANQFEQAFVGLVQSVQTGQRQSDAQRIERAVQELPENIKNLVTPEIRQQLDPTVFGLAQALANNSLSVPNDRELVKRAAQSLLTEQLLKQEHKRATDEISDKLEKRAAQQTDRPVHHRSVDPAMSPAERKRQAVRDIDAFGRERGMT